MPKLSIVVPTYNEKDTLAECVRRILAVHLPLEREIILVDDGSTDGTAQVIAQLTQETPPPALRTFTHPRNRGKGAALRTAFAHVTGDIVLVQDADLEYDPRDYSRLLRPILDGRADVVYGSRFVTTEERRVLLYWHAVGNKLLTTLSNMCTNLNLSDMETGYKVFRREVLQNLHLRSERFGIEPEITAKVARLGWRVYEVGISYSGRTYAEGKKITWRDGLAAFFTVLRFRFFD